MGAAKNILGLFVKFEDGEKEPSQPIVEPVKTTVVTSAVTPSSILPAQEDATIKAQLVEALEKANQPGYDYFEMAQAVQNMANIIPSEELRFQSVYATVSSMGVTPDKLISSAQFYLSILGNKESEFNKTVEQHMKEAVTSREQEIEKYDSDMKLKADQIRKLTEEINELQAKKLAVTNEVSSNKAKIDQVKNNFAATMRVFVDRINSDIEKIKKYLLKTN